MRCGLLIAWLLLAALPANADSFAEECGRHLPPATVQVHATFAEPAISFALSAAQIKPLAQSSQSGVSLGLTQVETRVDQRVSVPALLSTVDQRLCGRPQIELTLALHRVQILVARELLGDECAVAAVWHHELRHFAIHQETLVDVAREVERLMQAHYRDAVLMGSEAEIKAEIQRDLQERWSREIEVMQARGDAQHDALDARDAQLDERLCDGALARLASRLSRQQ
jgi:hypothetical protein